MPADVKARDKIDHALLAEIQQRVPVDHRPFQLLGERLGMSEQECLTRLDRLKTGAIIRRLTGLFDPVALGYRMSLVAMRLPPQRLEEAAAVISRHPGVSRADRMNDPFNFWFTIALPPADSLERVVNILHALAQSEETLLLPTSRVYKLGVRQHPDGEAAWLEHDEEGLDALRRANPSVTLTGQDIRFIRLFQEDLPLLELPFEVWAEQGDCTEDALFQWAKRAEHSGIMERFAALLAPASPGLAANAMIVWQVPPDAVDAVGEAMARFRDVTHCYQRPIYSSWPYALFTVIHAGSAAACTEAAKRIEENIGQFPHKHLFSAQAYKRAPITYFDPALTTWWEQVGLPADK